MSGTSTVRALFLAPLVEELRESGVDADEFLRRHGLHTSHLVKPYEFIPLRGFVALVEDMAERLHRPFLGLELGQKFGLAALGPFCPVLRLADTLSGALASLARIHPTWQTQTSLDIVRGETTAFMRYAIHDSAVWPHRQDAEFSLASFCAMIRQLTNENWRPLDVQFEHDIGHRAERLGSFFRARVTGNCATNLLVVANEALDRPLRWQVGPQDRVLQVNLERHLCEIFKSQPAECGTWTERVRSLIGRRFGGAAVDFDAVAAEMKLSGRTLRRRLTSEGTSFRQILREQRRSQMTNVLAHGGAPLSTLADRLNYSDASVLSRAFKNWTGLSPRQYAKANR